jgi:oligosaccharyltransferase complex subunit delta (ribophorin II)
MQSRSVFLLLCVVALGLVVDAAAPSNRGLSTTFTQADANALKAVLQSTDKFTDIHTAYYTTQALAQLDTKPTDAKTKELCTLAQDTLRNKQVLEGHDATSIHQALALAAQLKCDVAVDKAVTDSIKETIEEGDSAADFFHAVSAALAAREKTKKDISDDVLTSVIDKIDDLTESDGTVRASTNDKDGTLFNAGLALQLYGKLLSQLTLSVQDKEKVDDLAGKVETLLELANEGDNTLSFSSEDSSISSLLTTSAVVRGFQGLAAALKKPLDITPAQLGHIGEYFLSHKHASSAQDAYFLLTGLRAVQNSPKAPLALTLEKSSILSTARGAEGHIKVNVADIFDTAVPAKIYLVKAHSVAKPDTLILANQEITDGSLNFLAAKPEQGFYAVEFRAVPTDTNKYATIDAAPRRVKVIGSVSVTDLEITVAESKEARAEGSSYKADHPAKIEEVIQVGKSQFITVQFKVRNAGGSTSRPLQAQQAFVRFTNAKTGHEAVFVTTHNDNNKAYSVVVNTDEVAKSQFRSQSGEYTVSVVVGDAFIQNPIAWNVARINLQFEGTPSTAFAHSGLAPKSEIKHKERVAEKRPPTTISLLFTGLTLAPIALLLIGFTALGANIKKFPTGADFIPAVAFIGFIGAILALIVLYWLSLNLVQTLTYLSFLAIPTVFFGQRALSSLARKEKLA